MTAANRHPVVERYLEELRQALSEVPPRRRAELVAEIEEHLAETAPPGSSEAAVAEAIDRLGDPEEIAAAERERTGTYAPYEPSWTDWLAIPLLLFGGVLIPVFGWFVGVVLLWTSKIWTVRDKLWGTLLLPGGLLIGIGLLLAGADVETCTTVGGKQTCTGGISAAGRGALILLLVVCVVAPIVTAVRLGRKLRR
jgi:hypothetical protein